MLEPVNPLTRRDAELGRRPRRVGHLFGRTLADALRIAVAPDVGRRGSHGGARRSGRRRLADEVGGDREALEAVAVEDLPARIGIAGVRERLADVEVVAPAGELEPVEAPARGLLGDLLERQVGPLAGEEGDRACHWLPPGDR